MAKEKKMTNVINLPAGTYTAKVIGSGTLVCNVHDLPLFGPIYDSLTHDVQRQVIMHGVKQKVADGAAAVHGPEAYAGMKAIWAALIAGDWSSRGGVSGTSLVAEAYAAVTGKTPEKAAAALSEMDDAAVAKIRKGAAFKLEYKRIDYERARRTAEAAKATVVKPAAAA